MSTPTRWKNVVSHLKENFGIFRTVVPMKGVDEYLEDSDFNDHLEFLCEKQPHKMLPRAARIDEKCHEAIQKSKHEAETRKRGTGAQDDDAYNEKRRRSGSSEATEISASKLPFTCYHHLANVRIDKKYQIEKDITSGKAPEDIYEHLINLMEKYPATEFKNKSLDLQREVLLEEVKALEFEIVKYALLKFLNKCPAKPDTAHPASTPAAGTSICDMTAPEEVYVAALEKEAKGLEAGINQAYAQVRFFQLVNKQADGTSRETSARKRSHKMKQLATVQAGNVSEEALKEVIDRHRSHYWAGAHWMEVVEALEGDGAVVLFKVAGQCSFTGWHCRG